MARPRVAAGVLFFDGEDRVLLVRPSYKSGWDIPGGHVEPDESPEETMRREVHEETGVRIAPGRLVGVYSDPARQVIAYADGRRVQSVNLCFEARPLGADEPTTPEETLATGYFAPDALPEPFVPIHAIRIRDALDGDRAARIR